MKEDQRASFFRQSGWLMFANIAGGALNWGVHFLQKGVPEAMSQKEYGVFGDFLAMLMVIPTMSLQMVMAHQTALALATNREDQLRRLLRRATAGAVAIWAIAAGIVLCFQNRILMHWEIATPVGLWVTLIAVLFQILMPMFWGVLQGQQNFFTLGWSMMLNGVGRLFAGLIVVLVLAHLAASVVGSYAAGMMVGVAAGMAIATGLAVWQSRSVWHGASAPFAWRALAAEAVPPLFGFAAFQFLFTADQMFVGAYFPAEAGHYFSAGTLSRALIWLVGPLASVMFPLIVHSAAKGEKTNLMTLVLVGTAILAIVGSICLTIIAPYIIPIIYKPEYIPTVKAVLPWYTAAMVPLAVANVLLNNLLAKSAYKVVIPLCILAIAYGFALKTFHDSLVMVLQILGVANLVLLGICGLFTLLGSKSQKQLAT